VAAALYQKYNWRCLAIFSVAIFGDGIYCMRMKYHADEHRNQTTEEEEKKIAAIRRVHP
jgi:hypothetical protein